MDPDWLTRLHAQAAARDDSWVLLEGQATVEAALAGWWDVAGLLLADDHPWEVPAWSGLEVRRRSRAQVAAVGDPARHAGVLGLARVPAEIAEVAAFTKSLESDALLVVCPRLSDPILAGVVARQAEAIGAAGLLFGAEGVSPFDPRAVATSAGAVFRLPLRVADGGLILRCLKATAVDLTGLESGAGTVAGHPTTGRRALVIGDPESGLGPFWRAACDRRGDGDLETLLLGMVAKSG